jgi:hypothetical protein
MRICEILRRPVSILKVGGIFVHKNEIGDC